MVGRDTFSNACLDAFAFLVSRFDFDEPELVAIGRETYVRYHRKDGTVSVAWEAGTAPIVELFYPPTAASEQVIPWAERNGVSRCRRIPTLRVAEKFDEADEASFCRCLHAKASALGQVELAWLAA